MQSRHALIFLSLLAAVLAAASPVLAYGDRVVPHVPDGVGGDGTGYRTMFDITNLGPLLETRIRNVRVLFFRQNGTPWTLSTNLGNASEITLNLSAYQTFRIETTGAGPLTSGYVVIRNREPNSYFPEDFEVNVTAYYEVLRGGQVIDTVSVAVAQPTVAWIFPAETSVGRNLLTGFAVVNLASQPNTLRLKMFEEIPPISQSVAQPRETVNLTLAAGEQRAIFLNAPVLFPNLTSFKGMLRGDSSGPVAILALLQSPTPSGVQFATLAPSYMDALRTNNLVYLKQGFPLDADLALSDYTGTTEDTIAWDLLFESSAVSTSRRQLTPQNGAQASVIGVRSDQQFDTEITQSFLEGLTYTSNPIDLSDDSALLARDVVLAVRTSLGRYVKLRIHEVIAQGTQRHVVLETFPYR